MDLRVYKSKKSIYDAFISLRSKKELRKITVRELCEKAMINKSTFYTYYEDIFDLSDKIESEIVESIASSIPNPENMVENTTIFYRNLLEAMMSNHDIIGTVFSGAQHPNLVEKISKSLKSIFFKFHPECEQNRKFCIMLDYEIYGAYYVFEKNHTNGDSSELTETIGLINEHISTLMKAQNSTH